MIVPHSIVKVVISFETSESPQSLKVNGVHEVFDLHAALTEFFFAGAIVIGDHVGAHAHSDVAVVTGGDLLHFLSEGGEDDV
jgi:hypothetical protein